VQKTQVSNFVWASALAAVGLAVAGASGGTVLYVDDDASPGGTGLSWINPYSNLQDALADAAGGGVNEIRVAQGVYTPAGSVSSCCSPHGGLGCDDAACETAVCGVLPTCCVVAWDQVCATLAVDLCDPLCADPRTETFQLLNGVVVAGGYAGVNEPDPDARDIDMYETILSGDLAGDDGPGPFDNNAENSYTVVTGNGTDNTAVLDGVTVSGGNANGPVDEPQWTRGGGIWNLTGSPAIRQCRIEGNYAATFGGGVHNRVNSSPLFDDCTITGNVSGISGGAMFNLSGSLTEMTGCTFELNDASGGGGGMYNQSGSDVTITGCLFDSNSGLSAGAIFNLGSSPTIGDCEFVGNTGLGGGGGAIFNFQGSSPQVSGSSFTNNDAGEFNGGAMTSGTNSHPEVTDCTFTGNTGFSGGAVRNYENSNGTFTGCTFTANTTSSWGGGISNVGSSPMIIDCTFIGNTAYNGGAIHNYNNSSATIESCTISGNTASNVGGAIVNSNSSSAITDCTLHDNTALSGAGMFNYLSSPTIRRCEITSNQTTGSGVGGGMNNSTASSPLIENCLFADNSANGNGGAMLSALDCNPMLFNCTIVDNTTAMAGGGLFTTDSAGGHSEPVLVNCIVYGNNDVQIVDNAGSVTTVSYSDVQGGYAGTGNINANPVFADADYRLGPGSPCIDAGDNAAVPPGHDTDLDGNPRFVDDPATVDTGNGDPPIVDMGAYEYQPPACPCDCADPPDGTVNVVDFLALIGDWGGTGPCDCADPSDGVVNVVDFLAMLGAWGSCS
jgi:hypothetical protein